MKAVYTHGALTTTRKQVIDICLLIHLGQHFNIKKKKIPHTEGYIIYVHICMHTSVEANLFRSEDGDNQVTHLPTKIFTRCIL